MSILSMKTLSILIAVGGVSFPFLILALRWHCLRESERNRWALEPRVPLTETQLARLQRWHRTNLTLFVIWLVCGIGSAIVCWTGQISREDTPILFGIFLFLGLAGLLHHFSQSCPRCRMNIGVQNNLVLPRACVRCGAAFTERNM